MMNLSKHVLRLGVSALLLASTPAMADGVRSAQRDGYGRLVFDWDTPVRYAAEVVNGALVVQFERPVGSDVAPVTQALGPYVTGSRFSPDRKTLTFTLRPNITMRTFTVGSAVVLDLVSPQAPTSAAATPNNAAARAPATAPAAARAQAPVSVPPPANATPVAVRTGAHPDYFRVAFDWPSKTGYKVERRGDRVAVVFDGAAGIDIAALNQKLPAANRPAVTLQENGKTTVTFPIAPQMLVKDLASANTIAIDLTTQPTNAPADTKTPAPAAAAKDTKTAAAPPPAPAPKAAPPPPPPPPRSAKETAAVAALKGQNTETTEVDAAGKRVTRAAAANRVDPLTTRPAEISLTIPWNEPSAAAVFRRADYLWVVFDRYQQVDVAKLAKEGAPYITFVEQLPYRNNTILRMVTRPDINPTPRRDGLNWVLDFRALPLRPTRAIEINAQLDRPAPNLFLPLAEAGRTVAVEDPEVGDYLLIVPVIPLAYGIYPDRTFADLDMPITAQGVVVIPKSDGVRAQASRTGIDVDVDGGMALSKALASAEGALGGDDKMQRILNIADWQIGKADDYVRNKQALQNALGDERPDTRQQARFRLARFEFVNGFYPEVLAILRVMKGSDPEIENTGPYRALRGASNMMMRRYEEAADDFNHFSLANDDDARFWQAAARAKMGNPSVQAETLIQTGALIRAYPRAVKIPLALIGIDSTIAAGDDFGAQGFIDLIRKETPTVNELAAIDYMDGKLNQKIGELQVALQQYRKAEESSSLLYSVLGTRDRLELEHKLGTVTAEQLIEGLEKLRYRWRGDDIELDLLLRLADLYVAQKDYGTALRTLKITTSYFKDDPRIDEAAGKMTGIFEELYLNAASDKLSPVTSIALFDEFRSLVPPGEKGDEMIRKLADRLVSVDLLDSAAVLLERQVQFRVTGVDRARIGARLALVYLLNKQPTKAIETLNDTSTPDAARDLNAQRRRLEARALSEMVPDADAGSLSDGNARLVLDWATALTLAGDERTLVRVRQRYTVPMGSTPYKDAFVLITTPRERGVMDVASVRQQIQQAEQFKSFMVDYKDMIGQNPLSAIN